MRHLQHTAKLAVAFLVVFAASVAGGPAVSQDSYAGKTLALLVGAEAGTGYDVYGRIVGRHLVRHLPGQPAFITQNMPGAGSIKTAEYLYHIAPKDGTSIAIVFPGAIVEPLTGDKSKYRYDPLRFEYLGTADSGTRLCVTSLASKVQTFDDARKHTAIIGSMAPGSSTWDYPTMLNALVGTKFKIVSGYSATTHIAVAMERGEVDGWCGIDVSAHNAVRPQWLSQKQVHFVLQLGLEPNPDMTRLGFPWIMEFASADSRKVMELILSQQVFQRPFLAPPGTTADRVKLLRAAFMATMRDEAFLAEASKAKLGVNPRDGEQVATLVKSIYSSPPELVQRMANALKGH